MTQKYICFFLFAFCFFAVSSQNSKIDSLYRAYSSEKMDTNKVKTLLALSENFKPINAAKSLGFSREAFEISNRINYPNGMLRSCISIAEYYQEQLNYADAINYYLQAEVQAEKLNNFISLSRIYNSIGIVYSNQSRNDKSLQYFLKVAKISEEHNLTKRLPIAYNNIGISYKDLGRYSEALSYYEKALIEFEKTNFHKGIASVSNNIGIVSHLKGDDEKALAFYNKSVENFRKINDTASEAGIYTNIGEVYNSNKEYQKALDFYLKGLKLAQKFSNNNFRGDAYEGLAQVYANLKQFDKAYYYLNRHISLKDTIRDEEGMKKVQEIEKRMESQKREKEIEYLKQQDELQKLKVKSQNEKLNQSKLIIYSVLTILMVTLFLSLLLFKANKKVKQNNVELASKRKEIQDSINYAKHIQNAMLPDVRLLEKHFPEGFGLFLPKDVVSGDFYWFNELNDIVYFAAADCTGHGVPGAFMSMIAIDKLNQCLIDKNIDTVTEILSNLNTSIKKALKQSNEESISKDGLDIALCSFNRKKMELHYAGANRPLWIIRQNELIEFKPLKVSIAGFTDENQKFESHLIKVEKNDSVFLFSDGFADQFGGEGKKKFMTKQFKETLIQINDLPMSQQEIELEKIFKQWKGNLEQVDDVMVLGFRL